MIDDHFADGATDPDPGCTSTTDTSENSELLPAGDCDLRMGLLNEDPTVAFAVAQGCGVIQGFWLHVPGTAEDCGYQLGAEGAATQCEIVRETGGTMFAKTTLPLITVVPMTAPGDCRPMTLAVINGDNTVVAKRMKRQGC